MPASFPRYTTFQPGELEETLKALAPEREASLALAAASFPARRGKLIKEHGFPVAYPDGQEGTCSYERMGPACHRFRYRDTDGYTLPHQYSLRPLPNTLEAIEAKGKELASVCFAEAIERERKEYFMRASEPSDGSRHKRPEMYQMRAERAKEQAGKYALCREVGERLLPVSKLFERMEEANQAWIDSPEKELYVACCNRLDRCWEVPRYTPLLAMGHPIRTLQKPNESNQQGGSASDHA